MNYSTKRALIEVGAFILIATAFTAPSIYVRSVNDKKAKVEQQRNAEITNRLDSLRNIENLASRLEGYCPDCSYFGGYNFVDSLHKQYLKEREKLEVSFEDYLTNLFVEQQKVKTAHPVK